MVLQERAHDELLRSVLLLSQVPVEVVELAMHLSKLKARPILPISSIKQIPIVLLITNMRSVDVALHALEHYRPHFHSMIYMNPDGGCAGSHLKHLPCYECEGLSKFEHGYDISMYECSVRLSLLLESYFEFSNGEPKGILILHADFWITPKFLPTLRHLVDFYPDDFWLPNSKTNAFSKTKFDFNRTKHTSKPTPKSGWHWDVMHERVENARADFSRSNMTWSWCPDFPAAWVDLLFLPRSRWSVIHERFQILSRNAVLNETAVPVSLCMVGGNSVSVWCWGGCCSSLPDVDLLWNHSCGHKLRMNEGEHREVLSQIWSRTDFRTFFY